MQERILFKWGNSLALRIPKVEANDQGLAFRCVRKIRRYSMEEVLNSLHSTEEPREMVWNAPAGKEVW